MIIVLIVKNFAIFNRNYHDYHLNANTGNVVRESLGTFDDYLVNYHMS